MISQCCAMKGREIPSFFISKYTALVFPQSAASNFPCATVQRKQTKWPTFILVNSFGLQSRVASSKLSAGPNFQTVLRKYSTKLQLTQIKPIAGALHVSEQCRNSSSTQSLSHNCLIFLVKSCICSLLHNYAEGTDVSSLTCKKNCSRVYVIP